MEDKKIDLTALSEEYNIALVDKTMPNGSIVKQYNWTADDFAKLNTELLSKCHNKLDIEYLLANSPAPWLTIAAIHALKGLNVKYEYAGINMEMVKMEFMPEGLMLPANKNYDGQFILTDEGQNFYIEMTTDSEEAQKIGHHTFNFPDYYKVKLPYIPEGRDIFIHSWGTFCVMVCSGLTFLEKSKSLWLAWHNNDYVCAYSSVPENRPGDVKKRSRQNPLPHPS